MTSDRSGARETAYEQPEIDEQAVEAALRHRCSAIDVHRERLTAVRARWNELGGHVASEAGQIRGFRERLEGASTRSGVWASVRDIVDEVPGVRALPLSPRTAAEVARILFVRTKDRVREGRETALLLLRNVEDLETFAAEVSEQSEMARRDHGTANNLLREQSGVEKLDEAALLHHLQKLRATQYACQGYARLLDVAAGFVQTLRTIGPTLESELSVVEAELVPLEAPLQALERAGSERGQEIDAETLSVALSGLQPLLEQLGQVSRRAGRLFERHFSPAAESLGEFATWVGRTRAAMQAQASAPVHEQLDRVLARTAPATV